MIIQGQYASADVKNVEHNQKTMSQIYSMLNSPAICNPVVIMPDAHVGKGAVIGFTMRVSDKIIPSVIGVDQGCGVLTAKIEKPAQTLSEIDMIIRAAVPVGFNIHPTSTVNDYQARVKPLAKKVGVDFDYALRSYGTLGGGNHFIELGKARGDYYLTIHTGSRKLGYATAMYHQKKAIREHKNKRLGLGTINELKQIYTGVELGRQIDMLREKTRGAAIQKDLVYLEGDSANEYLEDMYICQRYASVNRATILINICEALGVRHIVVAESVHNFISPTDNIIRKGAISAHKDEIVAIPINRSFGTIIGRGRGNPGWNFSAPHGAGRLMSRRQAKDSITQEQADDLIGDIYSSFNPIDECDLVYKSPQVIIDALADIVEIDYIIRPILNIKG